MNCYFAEGVPKNTTEARKYFKLAADQRHTDAQHKYAYMVDKGEGGPKDFKEARKYFKLAADQDNKEVQYNYGVMLERGYGGPQDWKKAVAYYKRAADQVYADAQHKQLCGGKERVSQKIQKKREDDIN